MKIGTPKILDDYILSCRKKGGRGYLGMSEIGEPCSRKIWYNQNDPVPIEDPRVLRIFDLGNLIEDAMIKKLKEAGFELLDRDPDTGEQFRFTDLDERFSGGIDGVIRGLPESSKWHVWEMKSANDRRFKQFKEEGYISEPVYYGQIQLYMHYTGLDRAMVMVYNKNNSDIYYERIKYEKSTAKNLISKALEILEAEEPPERAYKRKSFYKCRFCNHKDKCWSNDVQDKIKQKRN